MDDLIQEDEYKIYRQLLAEAPPEEHRQVLLLLLKCLLEAAPTEPTEH